MTELIKQTWPWYLSGTAIALIMLVLIYFGRTFGVSSNLRTICSMMGTGKHVKFFDFNWKNERWNLLFIGGAIIGGILSSTILKNERPLDLSANTINDLRQLGIYFDGKLNPDALFSVKSALSVKGFSILFIGGLLVGFGARYAGGCTSGHAVSGLSNLQLPSLIAVTGFFIGGLMMTHLLFPLIF
ncbi:MAG TPA: YeeE/YedE thiosulfate transporter family protein [Pseudosphingobacterium sp.]|nr:YeeE/YedE thiosulfate transporter family protein [Pseudosphingobacterium sp.]